MSYCFLPVPSEPYIGALDHDGHVVPARFLPMKNRTLARIRNEELELMKRLEREALFRRAFT